MKTFFTKHTIFIGKSLLWSVLLYAATVLVLDWEEVIRKKDSIQLVKITQPDTVPQVSVSLASVANTLWISMARVLRYIH